MKVRVQLCKCTQTKISQSATNTIQVAMTHPMGEIETQKLMCEARETLFKTLYTHFLFLFSFSIKIHLAGLQKINKVWDSMALAAVQERNNTKHIHYRKCLSSKTFPASLLKSNNTLLQLVYKQRRHLNLQYKSK